MPKTTESLNSELFELLKSRGLDPVTLDSSGKETPVPDEADIFQFHFHSGDRNYGTVTIAIDGLKNLVLYYNDSVMKSDGELQDWIKFLKNLKRFAYRRQLGFELKNIDRLGSDMKRRTHTKKLEESVGWLEDALLSESSVGNMRKYFDDQAAKEPLNITKQREFFAKDKKDFPTKTQQFRSHDEYQRHLKQQAKGVAEGSLDEIGYSTELSDANYSTDNLLKIGKPYDTIEGNNVMTVSQGPVEVYFLVIDGQVTAFLGFKNNRLKNIKNFTKTPGVIRALIGCLVHKHNKKIIIDSNEPLTADGLKWVRHLIKSPRGLSITDKSGEHIDVDALHKEWNTARQTGKSGTTTIMIGENSEFGKKLRENEALRESKSLLMPHNFYEIVVAEDSSSAMASMADRLTNKDDGKVAKLRAAGDKRREEQMKGRYLAQRDTDSKDEWGNIKKDVSEAAGDDFWGPQGNFAGDRTVNLGGVTMKTVEVGDTVKYFGQKAKVVAMSKDRKHSRINILSDFGGTTKDVLTSDLKQLGQGMAEAKKKRKKKSSKASKQLRGYFFPGYGYYGFGSDESGGDGGGGESVAEDQLDEKWSQKYKSSINCSHPKGFSQKAHCAGKKKHNESIEMEMTCPDCGMCETHGDNSRNTLDEACWKGYHKEGNKKMFGKTYPNCVKNKKKTNEEGVAEVQLNELFDMQQEYFKLADGTPIQVDFRQAGLNADAIPGSITITPVNPKIMPMSGMQSIKPWDKARQNIRMAIQKWVQSGKQGVTEDNTKRWDGRGFSVRSTHLWPAIMFESESDVAGEFNKWLNHQRESQKTPSKNAPCILAMVIRDAGQISVLYGPAKYIGQTDSEYQLKIDSGAHQYSKGANQIVFDSKSSLEKFMMILKLKYQDKDIEIHSKEMPVMETSASANDNFNHEYDDEAGMAKSNLLTIARAARGLLGTIEDRDNLPEWAQEKIAKVEGMLVNVWDYLQSQKEQGIDPKVALAQPNSEMLDSLKTELAGIYEQLTAKKSSIAEGYYGTKNTSYSDNAPATIKMIIKHNRPMGEGDQRFRHIARIFLESDTGARWPVPTVKPSVARVFARHLAEGGDYNDERWNHITQLSEDIDSLSGFVRATRNRQFNESTTRVVGEVTEQWGNLKKTIKQLSGTRGYHNYFESWSPQLMESDMDASSLLGHFTNSTIDPRIERAIPVLARMNISVTEISEAEDFKNWADSVLEEALLEEEPGIFETDQPDLRGQRDQLIELLGPDSEPMPVGPDAMNAIGILSDVIEDDGLNRRLVRVASVDPDQDARDTIIAWMREQSNNTVYDEVIDEIGKDDTSDAAPAPAKKAALPAAQKPAKSDDVDIPPPVAEDEISAFKKLLSR